MKPQFTEQVKHIVDAIEALFDDAHSGNPDDIDKLFHTVSDEIRGGLIPEELAAIQNITVWSQRNDAIHPYGAGLALSVLAFVDFLTSKFEASIEKLNQSVALFESLESKEGLAVAFLFLAINYRALGAQDEALKYVMEAQARFRHSNKFPLIDVTCGFQLAELHAETGNHHEAINIFLEYLEKAKATGNAFSISRLQSGLGSAYLKAHNYELAIVNLNAALKMSEENNLHSVTGRILTDIGEYHTLQKNYSLAIEYNNKALALRHRLDLRNAIITNKVNIADIYHRQQKTDDAIQLLLEALVIADELKVKTKVYHIQEMLSGFYEAKGDLKQSLHFFRKFHATKGALSAEDSEQRIKKVKLVMEAEQTRKENAVIKAQKQQIEEKHVALVAEKQRSDALLLNILPAEVAQELKDTGRAKAKHFNDVTVLFTDFANFTTISERLSPQQLVDELHQCFEAFDAIVDKYNIEKIKTIGDAYMAVCGLPVADDNHAENVVNAALEISRFMARRKAESNGNIFDIRIGVNSGSVVAGIVGVKKFAYDVWGDTVNTAARMEASGCAGKVNISESTYELVKGKFKCEHRGAVEAKNKGKLNMYFVEAR